MLGAAILLPASPAAAASKGCAIPSGNYSCTSERLSVSSRFVISVLSGARNGPVTCRAYDSGGTQRGSVSNSSSSVLKSQPFTGPSGSYFLTCVGSNGNGGGNGSITN